MQLQFPNQSTNQTNPTNPIIIQNSKFKTQNSKLLHPEPNKPKEPGQPNKLMQEGSGCGLDEKVIYINIYHKGSRMKSTRTIITLSCDDKKWLEGYSKAHNVSVAEAVRRGIYILKAAESNATYQTLLKETKGLWKKGDGLKYQENMRDEWSK